jgi:hypothetical protein
MSARTVYILLGHVWLLNLSPMKKRKLCQDSYSNFFCLVGSGWFFSVAYAAWNEHHHQFTSRFIANAFPTILFYLLRRVVFFLSSQNKKISFASFDCKRQLKPNTFIIKLVSNELKFTGSTLSVHVPFLSKLNLLFPYQD